MNGKLLGAMLIVLACGGFGFSLAAAHRREESALAQLIRGLDFMACELQYRLTPLPELCRQTSEELTGPVGQVFAALAEQLQSQSQPEAGKCMAEALAAQTELPDQAKRILGELGQTLGRFDLPGQLQGLDGARQSCRGCLEALSRNRESRLRSYQTLGLCAGAALAILFL